MVAQTHLHPAQAVSLHHVNEVHVDQRAAMNLHELIRIQFFNQRLDRFANKGFAVFGDDNSLKQF